MADILISIVTKVAEYLVEPAIRQGQYFLCVKKVIKDVENEKEELAFERDRLQGRIKKAKERAEVVEEPVEKWLNNVENLLKEVEDLERRMTINNNCFPGWCPTWKRYRLCKQMEEKKKAMVNFRGNNNFEPFSHPAPLPGIQYQSSGNFTYFESTKVAYNQLLEALHDEQVYMIGVYGMGGSGKTTLVTEAGKKVESELFEKVIKITVSQTPNIKDIQGEVARKLNLKLEEESEDERAQRLWLSLKEKNRILVIVDDLWTKFDLKHIGICIDDNYKGKSKFLITSRNEHVCSSMDCQKKIHLKLLSKDESWTLFKKCANIDDDFSKSLDDRPRKVCCKCKELPLAIATVGSSLKGKSKAADWEVALCSLSQPEVIHDDHVDDGVKNVFTCLKFSYDYLENKEAKLLFLICSMFPEDYNISTEDLIRYAVGVRQGARIPLKSARYFIEANINKLLQSCLLMHADKGKHYVKMHDLVRDTAIWIGKRSENCKFLFSLDKLLRDLAEDATIGDCFALSSWYNENQICKDDAQLKAPNLEILLLNMKFWEGSLDFSDATFEEMKWLKVFAIINNLGVYPRLLSLPQSTELLKNLRTLRLNHWQLGDISFIASLTRIEVLDLQNCRFNALPNDIEKLKGLKLLDLSNCHIEENYNGAIGKCSRLEELYFSGTSKYHHQSIMDIGSLPELQRFIIKNIADLTLDDVESKRALAVEDFNISNSGKPEKNLLQIVDSVHLRRLSGGCKNIFPDMVGVVGSMNGLTTLRLHECQEIECIFDTTSGSKIPGLVDLRLESMENLKELCRGPPLQVLRVFEKLEILQIRHCHQLHFPRKCNLQNLKILTIEISYSLGQNTTTAEVLFSTSVAQSLQQLEELKINGCHDLKHIVACEREHVSNASEEIVPTPSRSRFVLPSLKEVVISSCRKLESIFQIDCVEGQIELPRLEYMTLRSLENLIRICPENYGVKWPSLRHIGVSYCPKLSTLWIAMMAGSEQRQQLLNEQKQLLSTLKLLSLLKLPQLNHIPCVGPTPGQILDLQCLQHIYIYKCENLKYLFSMAVIRSLPELISLDIENCEELEQIIVANEELVQLSNAEVYFPKLTDIKVFGCNKLESLFSVAMVRMLPQLSTISIWSATQLKEVYRQCSGDDTINEMEIVLPNMTYIRLYNLPSFVDICQGHKFMAEKLKEFYIYECPKICSSLKAIQYFTYRGMPAVEGSSDKLEALLSQNITTEDHQLLLAASEGDKDEIETLLIFGAKYDVKDIYGRTALDRANDEIKDFILSFSVSSSNTDEEGNS